MRGEIEAAAGSSGSSLKDRYRRPKAAGLILCTDCAADRVEHRAIIRETRISWDRWPV